MSSLLLKFKIVSSCNLASDCGIEPNKLLCDKSRLSIFF